MSDVTVHIDESLDSSALLHLRHDLSCMSGVQSVDANAKRPHLMVVHYDHQRVHSGRILSQFLGHGYHAELIGF